VPGQSEIMHRWCGYRRLISLPRRGATGDAKGCKGGAKNPSKFDGGRGGIYARESARNSTRVGVELYGRPERVIALLFNEYPLNWEQESARLWARTRMGPDRVPVCPLE
jgi:hypothetical protein